MVPDSLQVMGTIGYQLWMVGSVRDEIWAWKSISRQRKCFDIISLTIFWELWNERNRRASEG